MSEVVAAGFPAWSFHSAPCSPPRGCCPGSGLRPCRSCTALRGGDAHSSPPASRAAGPGAAPVPAAGPGAAGDRGAACWGRRGSGTYSCGGPWAQGQPLCSAQGTALLPCEPPAPRAPEGRPRLPPAPPAQGLRGTGSSLLLAGCSRLWRPWCCSPSTGFLCRHLPLLGVLRVTPCLRGSGGGGLPRDSVCETGGGGGFTWEMVQGRQGTLSR